MSEMRVWAVNSARDACEFMELIRIVEDPEFLVSDDFKMHLVVLAAKELESAVRRTMPSATKLEDDSPMNELAVISTAD